MKKLTTLLCLMATLFIWSCQKETPIGPITNDPVERAKPFEALPSWVQHQINNPAQDEVIENDFAQVLNPGDCDRITEEVVSTLKYYGRAIDHHTVAALLEGLPSEEKQRVKDQYFYDEQVTIRTASNIRTRNKFNNATYNYSTFGIYFEILTNLNTTLADGTLNSLDYNTAGISAGKWTFADLVVSGRALNNQTSLNLTDFDPLQMDFHYYEGTGNPIYYSGWYMEMVYEGDITVNGTTYPGPFGTQDGSNFNYIYMNPTVANENFTDIGDGEIFPQFPLYDFVVYIAIQGQDPIYILGSDLF